MRKQYRVGPDKLLIEDAQRGAVGVRGEWVKREIARQDVVRVRADLALIMWTVALVAGMFIGVVLGSAK